MAPHAGIDRRRLLATAAACATTLWLPRSAWTQARMTADPFTLGVASGSPDDTSVVLWTRLMGGDSAGWGNVTVRWEVAHDDGFQRIVQRGQAQAVPALAHSVHVEAAGLEPDRWYFYRFSAGEWTSPVGRTRTLPAPDAPVQRLRLGYASCQRWEHGYYAAWRHLRADQPDLVLFLGDYIYEYPGALGAVRWPDGLWLLTLEDYRARHALHKSDRDLQQMHAACPWLLAWDDHEVQNDYAGAHPGNAGPQVEDHAARRAAAYQAYYEHMPLRAAVLGRALDGLAPGSELRIYSQVRFGRLARLSLLDTRQYRDAQACTAGGRYGSSRLDPTTCAALDDPRRTLLGAPQEQWLDAQFASAPAGWTVIGQSTLFGARDLLPGPGRMVWNDGWDGYPAARRRLTDALQARGVRNAVVFGGDVHQNWVGHLKADYSRPASPAIGVEFCGTSISSRTSGAEHLPALLAENPHFTFADAQWRGYGLADFTPAQLSVRLRAVRDVEKRDSDAFTLASFVVPAGEARVERG